MKTAVCHTCCRLSVTVATAFAPPRSTTSRVLQTGARCESEGEEYLKTVAAVEACYQSAAKGQVVKIEDRMKIEDRGSKIEDR